MKIGLVILLIIILIVAIVGLVLPNERSFTAKTIINSNPEKVFKTVTNISHQNWRSQVGKVDVLDSTEGREVWIEQPNKGPAIKFRTKVKISPTRFEIEIIDSEDFGGNWVGTFAETSDGKTEVAFTERVIVTKVMAKLLSYTFFNVEDSVNTYINDLKKAVE